MEYARIWSTQPEFKDVLEALKEMGEPLPNILLPCVAILQRKQGKVVGIAVIQCLPVVEPFLTDNGHDSVRLLNEVENVVSEIGVPRLLMHTEDEKMEKMIATHGAFKSPWTWYERRA